MSSLKPRTASIPFFHTHVAPRAVELVTDVIRSGWLNEGEVVKKFEATLASTMGVANPVAVNSGTAALHLALVIAGVGPGDEVIIPAQTFVATGTVVLMAGATPVFADIDPHTGNIAPASIAEKITPRTKAVIPVHWGGYPCDLDEIAQIAREHRLVVVEDAAHALGATYRTVPIGAISRFTAFSFQAIKPVTAGDGGAICCPSTEDARAGVARRWFGIDRQAVVRTLIGARGYDIDTLGFKYHMNNVAAAIGLANLEDFPSRLAHRRRNALDLQRRLRGCSGVELLEFRNDREHAYWMLTIKVERRDDFARKVIDHGVGVSVVDLRIDRNSIFGGMRKDLPGQEEFDARQISLPVHEGVTLADVEFIADVIRSGW